MNFNPFPAITTERLLLRRLKASDCEAILFLRTDKNVNKFIERPDHRKTKNISQARILIEEFDSCIDANHSITWGITLINSHQLIGTICLWNFSQNNKTAEVGYDLHPELQNQGVMSEAMKVVVAFGFKELNLNKIVAFTHTENVHSKKLLEKHGFHHNVNRKDLDNKSNIIFELEN